MLNVKTVGEDTEEEKVEKGKTFAEKYAKEIKHFGRRFHRSGSRKTRRGVTDAPWRPPPGMLSRWDDSQKYLSDNPHLACEETANRLVAMCVDLEIDEVSARARRPLKRSV